MTQETKTKNPHAPWDWHGPWKVVNGDEAHDAQGIPILQVVHYSEDNDWDSAAAARIVACVNACADYRDPEMVLRWMKSIAVDTKGKPNFGELISIMETQNAEIAALKEQNAELLERLEYWMNKAGGI